MNGSVNNLMNDSMNSLVNGSVNGSVNPFDFHEKLGWVCETDVGKNFLKLPTLPSRAEFCLGNTVRVCQMSCKVVRHLESSPRISESILLEILDDGTGQVPSDEERYILLHLQPFCSAFYEWHLLNRLMDEIPENRSFPLPLPSALFYSTEAEQADVLLLVEGNDTGYKSLASVVAGDTPISTTVVLFVVLSLLSVVRELHKVGIICCNLALTNIYCRFDESELCGAPERFTTLDDWNTQGVWLDHFECSIGVKLLAQRHPDLVHFCCPWKGAERLYEQYAAGGVRWVHQIDLWQLADILHHLLFRRPLETVFHAQERRYDVAALPADTPPLFATVFARLLNTPCLTLAEFDRGGHGACGYDELVDTIEHALRAEECFRDQLMEFCNTIHR